MILTIFQSAQSCGSKPERVPLYLYALRWLVGSCRDYSYRMTMALFAVALNGQCCSRHVVGQRVVSSISAVRIIEVFVACVLNLIILIS